MKRLPAVVPALAAAALGAALLTPAGADAAGPSSGVGDHARRSLPPRSVWLEQTQQALKGANRYLDAQARKADPRTLAIVLDIDNTSIQTRYAWPKAVPATRRVARHAADLGIHVFFVTGRHNGAELRTATSQLGRVGYVYDRAFGRRLGEGLLHEKSRHRTRITERLGLTIIADIGNHMTDLTGPYTGRTYKLPDYGGQLS